MKKLRSIFVEKPASGRRLVIADIHGCSRTFKKLLKKLKFTTSDQLFLLGDAVNKGVNSSKVLDHIMKLRHTGHQVFFIRGNHEQIVLNSKNKTVAQRKRMLKSLNSLDLLEGKKIKESYFELLKSSYHFIELNEYFLVHAGFDHRENTFSNQRAMLEIRDFKYDEVLFKNKQLIIGHTPRSFEKIKNDVVKKKSILCIDNGCVNIQDEGQGKLLCLNMDTYKIHTQKYKES